LDPKELFEKIKKNKWAWLIYVPITIPLVLLFMLSGTCLGPLMSAIVIFGIPYLFGVRNLGKFFKVGTFIVIVSGVVFGIMYTSFIYDQSYFFEEKTLGNSALSGGLVSPYRGDPGDVFNFTVTYEGTEPVENVSVFVNITNLGGEDTENLTMNRSENLFFVESEMGKSLYFYRFEVHLPQEGKWLQTKDGVGPLTMEYSEMLQIQIIQGIIYMLLWAGLFFYMVLVLYWWSKGARKQRMELEKKQKEEADEFAEDEEAEDGEEKEEPMEEFECTECGASVPEDADVCPNCGDTFDDDEKGVDKIAIEEHEEDEDRNTGEKEEKISVNIKEEFECTECGASVPEDADTCPSCGETFEDD
jgi:RNA polymerase subunit RPABC4/transcription elongation factor Spt4